MTVSTRTAPNYTTQSAAQYKANIDAAFAADARFGNAFAPHAVESGSPAPDWALVVEAGSLASGTTVREIAAQTVSGFTAPAGGMHRVDRVVIDAATGVASRVAGTAVTGSPSAVPPAIPAGKLPIAQVLIAAADTAITNSMITDERVLAFGGGQEVASVTGFNIAAGTDVGSPTDANNRIFITADELILKDASGNAMLVRSVSVVASTLLQGAVNGYDIVSSPTQETNTWLYGYVIATPDGTLGGLLSKSSSAPTLPSGYTHYARVTAARKNGSGNFIAYKQRGFDVQYNGAYVETAVISGGTATTATDIWEPNFSLFVPPIAEQYLISVYATHSELSSYNFIYLRHTAGLNATETLGLCAINAADLTFGEITFPNTGYFSYSFNSATSGRSFSAWIRGFTLPGGGR